MVRIPVRSDLSMWVPIPEISALLISSLLDEETPEVELGLV